MENLAKFENTQVYGLENSMKAAAYPLNPYVEDREVTEADIKRIKRLGKTPQGSGHDCALKGIIVQVDITFSQYIWQQAKRYHWFDFVSSTSTMHCITKMDISKQCNCYVFPSTISELKHAVELYNNWADNTPIKASEWYNQAVKDKSDLFHVIISNIPSGFMLKAAITTNYLQLKTMYNQRKHHKMKDWKVFCDWCETLPMFKEIINV